MSIYTRMCAALLAAVYAGSALASLTISGTVVEGNNQSQGIYNVRVEVLKHEKVVASARTMENGTFTLTLGGSLPFSGMVRYSKVGYKEYPTRKPIVAVANTKLAPILLVPEDASQQYAAEMAERLLQAKRSGNPQQVNAFYPSILALPPGRKAFVLEQVRDKDADLFAALNQADRAQANATEFQSELRKKDPSIFVFPDYAAAAKDKFIIYGAPDAKSKPGLTTWDKDKVLTYGSRQTQVN